MASSSSHPSTISCSTYQSVFSNLIENYLVKGDAEIELKLTQLMIQYGHDLTADQKNSLEIFLLKILEKKEPIYRNDIMSLYCQYVKKNAEEAAQYEKYALKLKSLDDIKPLSNDTGVFVITEDMLLKARLQNKKFELMPELKSIQNEDLDELIDIVSQATYALDEQKPGDEKTKHWDKRFREVKLSDVTMKKAEALIKKLSAIEHYFPDEGFSLPALDFSFGPQGNMTQFAWLAINNRMNEMVTLLLDAGVSTNGTLLSAIIMAMNYLEATGELDLTIINMLLKKDEKYKYNVWMHLENLELKNGDLRPQRESLIKLLMQHAVNPFVGYSHILSPLQVLLKLRTPNPECLYLTLIHYPHRPTAAELNFISPDADSVLSLVIQRIQNSRYFLKIMNRLIEWGVAIGPDIDQFERALVGANIADPMLLVCLKNVEARFEDKSMLTLYPLGVDASYLPKLKQAIAKIEELHNMIHLVTLLPSLTTVLGFPFGFTIPDCGLCS